MLWVFISCKTEKEKAVCLLRADVCLDPLSFTSFLISDVVAVAVFFLVGPPRLEMIRFSLCIRTGICSVSLRICR